MTAAFSRLPLLALLLAACGGSKLVNTEVIDEDDGTGPKGSPQAFINATQMDFGTVEVLTSSTQSFELENTGNGPLNVSFAVDNAEFIPLVADFTLGPSSSATISVRYTPIDYTADLSSLTITTDDEDNPSFSITLRGAAITDADDDGYASVEAGGSDCDDDDASVNPGMNEIWYDGKDSNCDRDDDYDQDGDGFQTSTYNADPLGGGGDCQDNNPAMFPGAPDAWYDGVDSDCAGGDDFDADADGWRSLEYGAGSDCDDSRPEVNPDNTELLNGLDDDCDGVADNEVPGWNATYRWEGPAVGAEAGRFLTMGDLDDDGDQDLIIGAPGVNSGQGAVAIIDGGLALPADGARISAGANYFTGDGPTDGLGEGLAFLERSGLYQDTFLAIGAREANSGYGKVFIIPGSAARAGGDTYSAVAIISGTGGSGGHDVGSTITEDLDINGDGSMDLFGYYQINTDPRPVPYIWHLDGTAYDTASIVNLGLSSVTARWSTDGGGGVGSPDSRMDQYIPRGGDLDGDGYDDLLYCDFMSDYSGTNDGVTWTLFGDAAGYSRSSVNNIETDAVVTTHGSQYEQLGVACAFQPDVDGDGDDELWVFNKGLDLLYLVEGGPDRRDGPVSPDDAMLAAYQWSSSANEPYVMSLVGDLTGDGVEEMGVTLDGGSAAQSGKVYIYDGTAQGELHYEDDAFGLVEGDFDTDLFAYNSRFGQGLLQRPGDFNRDGKLDFIVGDYGWGNTGSENTGAVFVTLGR